MAESSFKDHANCDKYLMLPSFWQDMDSNKKKSIFEIVKNNGGWTVQCLNGLRKTHNIPIKDMQNIRVCVECAEGNPDHLEQSGIEKIATSATGEKYEEEEIEETMKSRAIKSNINNGLVNFQLKPKGLTNKELFKHMIWFREIHATKEQ